MACPLRTARKDRGWALLAAACRGRQWSVPFCDVHTGLWELRGGDAGVVREDFLEEQGFTLQWWVDVGGWGSPSGKSMEEQPFPRPLVEGWDLFLAGGHSLLCVSCTLQMPSGWPCVHLMSMFWGWGHGVDKSRTILLLGSWED